MTKKTLQTESRLDRPGSGTLEFRKSITDLLNYIENMNSITTMVAIDPKSPQYPDNQNIRNPKVRLMNWLDYFQAVAPVTDDSLSLKFNRIYELLEETDPKPTDIDIAQRIMDLVVNRAVHVQPKRRYITNHPDMVESRKSRKRERKSSLYQDVIQEMERQFAGYGENVLNEIGSETRSRVRSKFARKPAGSKKN